MSILYRKVCIIITAMIYKYLLNHRSVYILLFGLLIQIYHGHTVGIAYSIYEKLIFNIKIR